MPFDGADWKTRLAATAPERDGLSIFQVMPREMHFGPSGATSIDLCVRDLIAFSRYRASTLVFAEEREDFFEGFAIESLPEIKRAVTFRRANRVARAIRRARPDLVIVQQHLPTAAAIAMRVPDVPVILHTHNFQKAYRPSASPVAALRRRARAARYNRLSGIIHVSGACERAFADRWPSTGLPGCVVANGIDFASWTPSRERAHEILYVGRCAPEKGVLEAARATVSVLSRWPGWRARFVLSAINSHPGYAREVSSTLTRLGAQACIEIQQPFAAIKAANERAAIVIAPSHCPEAFGRTALEAHAGGAALVSSGSGALPEVSGRGGALFLPAVAPEPIVAAIETLIRDEALRGRLAAIGARHVREHFDIRAQAGRLDEYCLAMASAKQAQAGPRAQLRRTA
jgi:glycosyltransferase involved in cell wall biosynthesis